VRKRGNIVSYTAEELKEMIERGEDQTDWARVDAMTEAELDAAIARDPDWADIPRDWYKHATPRDSKGKKTQIRLRIDPDLLAWIFERRPVPPEHDHEVFHLLVVAAAVALATIFLPALVHHSSYPLTDSWGLALEATAFAAALLTLDRGRRWLALWVLAILVLSFTRDSVWIPVLAVGFCAWRMRSRQRARSRAAVPSVSAVTAPWAGR